MSSQRQVNIAIVGGGIAGITLAIALYNRGIPCKIYEQAHAFGEIGAGVAFTKNAIASMRVCAPGVYNAFLKVATHNMWESKSDVWFDFLDGTEQKSGYQSSKFSVKAEVGQNGVYRAAFLDELVKLLPEGISNFNKRLETITEDEKTGEMIMHFHDGSTATADAVVGCDGIKSKVRQCIVGEDHPSAHPAYSHKYAYRGLIPMENALEAVGDERAMNACLYMGPDKHILTFPINHGSILNLVGFVTDPNEWPDFHHLTRPAKREQVLEDYQDFGPNIQALIKLTKPELDCWAIFDTNDHPVPTFVDPKRPIVVSGDAAHATSPHHGAGAGYAIEDSAILSSILASPSIYRSSDPVTMRKNLHIAFQVFDAERRERTQSLVASSRREGDLYEWRTEVGKDLVKMEEKIMEKNRVIWNGDVLKMCDEAAVELDRKLRRGEN